METDVRCSGKGRITAYVSECERLLTEKGHRFVVVSGAGKSMNKAVSVTEIVKRKISGLHQLNELFRVDIQGLYVRLMSVRNTVVEMVRRKLFLV